MGLFSNKKNLNDIVLSGDKDLLVQSIKDGADVNYKDIRGWTPLKVAVSMGNIEIVEILLNNGASTYLSNPLLLACVNKDVEIIKLFFQYGADVNISDSNGWTPLMVAAQQGSLEIVQLLLERGAKIDAKTDEGWTALDAASQNNHNDIVTILNKAMPQVKVNGKVKNKVSIIKKPSKIKSKTSTGKQTIKIAIELLKLILTSKRKKSEDEKIRQIFRGLTPKEIVTVIISIWVLLMLILIVSNSLGK